LVESGFVNFDSSNPTLGKPNLSKGHVTKTTLWIWVIKTGFANMGNPRPGFLMLFCDIGFANPDFLFRL
jgi:hypothetical protein